MVAYLLQHTMGFFPWHGTCFISLRIVETMPWGFLLLSPWLFFTLRTTLHHSNTFSCLWFHPEAIPGPGYLGPTFVSRAKVNEDSSRGREETRTMSYTPAMKPLRGFP